MADHSTDHRVTSWLMPTLLSVTVALLGWMSLNLNRISESLAVAVYKIDNHDKRIETIEHHIWPH